MIYDFRFQPHKVSAYSVIYDWRLSDSATKLAVTCGTVDFIDLMNLMDFIDLIVSTIRRFSILLGWLRRSGCRG